MQPEQQQRIMGYFIEEAKDHLGTIEQGLLNLQGTMEDPEMVNEVFRAAHSVKGGAAMLGLDSIQRTAHRLEDSFKILKESPVKIDRKLETLFLRVKDILQELLEQLQGPFGLTEEIAGTIMSGVDPLFEDLNNHLEYLVHGEVVTTGTPKVTKAKVPVPLNKKAIQQVFQKDVVVRLREMLQQFKQPDAIERRQQLQADCQYLASLGKQFNLTAWVELLEIGKAAIATPTNAYRNLASVAIKEIKQAQELVLAGRVDEIVPSEALKALVPDWSLVISHSPLAEEALSQIAETPEIDPRETVYQADTSFPQDLTVEQPQEYVYETQSASPPPQRRMNMRENSPSSDPNGPEVGMAELNSLADLFEGESPDLDQTWQEEEMISPAVNERLHPAPSRDLFDQGDFSDLLGDTNNVTDASTESTAEDLMSLFGDEVPAESQAATNSTTETDDFSDLLFETESPTTPSSELTDLFGEDFFEEDSFEGVPPVSLANNGSTSRDELLDSLNGAGIEPSESLSDVDETSEMLRDDSLDDLFAEPEENQSPLVSSSEASFLELNDLQSFFPDESAIASDSPNNDDWVDFAPQEYVIEDNVSDDLNGDVQPSSQADWEDLFGEDISAPEEANALNLDEFSNQFQTDLDLDGSVPVSADNRLFEEPFTSSSESPLEAVTPQAEAPMSPFSEAWELEDEAQFDLDDTLYPPLFSEEPDTEQLEATSELDFLEEPEAIAPSLSDDLSEFDLDNPTPTTDKLTDFNEALFNLSTEETEVRLNDAENLEALFGDDGSSDLSIETSLAREEAFDWEGVSTPSETEELEELNAEAFDWETPASESEALPELELSSNLSVEAFDWEGVSAPSETSEALEELNAEAFDWETPASEAEALPELELSSNLSEEAFDWEGVSAPSETSEALEELNVEAFDWEGVSESSGTSEELEELNAEAFDWETPASEAEALPELELSSNLSEEAFDWEGVSAPSETSEELNAEAFDWETPASESEALPELELSSNLSEEAFDWESAEVEEATTDPLLDLAASELSPEAAVDLEALLKAESTPPESQFELEDGLDLLSEDPLLDFAIEDAEAADGDNLDDFFQAEATPSLADSDFESDFSWEFDAEETPQLNDLNEPVAGLEEFDEWLDQPESAFDAVAQMDSDNLLDSPTTDTEFDDLDLLLDEPMMADSLTANRNEFDDLDALLGDELTAPSMAPRRQTESVIASADLIEEGLDDEFGDLEKLLEQADQTMSGQPMAKSSSGSNRPTNRPRQTRVFEQTMRVPVKQLDNLNNLMGELVVNRNTLEQDQERLRQFLDNLLNQVQQLSDVGSRMQDLYERSLLESSLLASRQSYQSPSVPGGGNTPSDTHSSGAKFDVLEMDRFTGFHLLSQEMIELIVRVRESASDITFLVDETDQVARMLRQVTTQLQEGLTRSRMVPFAQTADRLPRAVREISVKLRKSAELHIEGRETLIDKMILEHLYDPMTHLVNNAITHGIETPEERAAAGKPPTGRITIRTFHQGNQTIISVSDDGAGINPDQVKVKAIEKGLVSAAEAKKLSRLEVYELLFHAGFSTKDQADDYSGRGVGMDVVRTSISEIRGAVTIDSTIGKGTTFTIRLPLTLSICKALCCLSDRTRIAFPMDGVEEMNDIPNSRIQTNAEGQTCFQWRDTLMPFQPLNELLTYNRQLSRGNVYGGNREDDAISIVVLRSAGNFIAVQVDQVLGEREIVIKQLEGPVPKPVGVAGATVLGDGHIMPIADVLELIDISTGRIRKDNGGDLWKSTTPNLPQEMVPIKTEPMVLIVDDSITVRELLSMTFNKSGYRVEQARDGQEAWEKLRSGLPCDIVFCDIEMPRMDGLELLSRLQKDENLCNLPIAMLTSRGADRHRQLAAQLGASGYFTKPYLEEMLLDAAQRMIKGEVLLTGSSSVTPNP